MACIDELLEKGQITYFEYYKCKNYLKIANFSKSKNAVDIG